MNKTIRNIFMGMKVFDVSEFLLLVLCTVTLPWSWAVSLKVMYLLILNGIVKCIVSKGFGNKYIDKQGKLCLWIMIAFYFIYVISSFYSDNKAVAFNFLARKLPLIVFAIYFLVCSTHHLNHNRLRTIGFAFSLSLVVKFFFRLIINIVTHGTIVFNSTFDPLHHTYMAMYLLFAIWFLYSELHRQWQTAKKEQRILLLTSLLILIIYIVLIQSRTGIGGIILIAIAAVLHQTIVTKQIKTALIAIIVAFSCGTAIFLLTPDKHHRMTETLIEVSEGNKSDIRYFIMGTSLNLAIDNLPWGVGVGDRPEQLLQEYRRLNNEKAIASEYNPHNIYIDSLLTAGIPSLVLLLALLITPLVIAIKRRDLVIVGLIGTIAFTGMFEEIFDRQMGIIFVGLLYSLCCIGIAKPSTLN